MRTAHYLGIAVLGLALLAQPAAAHLAARSLPGRACDVTADSLGALAGSAEILTVVAPSLSSQSGVATLFEQSAGCLRQVAGPYPAEIGVNGLSGTHREGDGTTPIGLFGFGVTMYGASPNPGVRYAYHQLVCGDWWDEDPSSLSYNTFVHVPCGTAPRFSGDSEALWRSLPAYDYLAVIDYNTRPVVKGAGSGIFLHVSTGGPTVGCVSLPVNDLLVVLRALDPRLHPKIAIGSPETLRVLSHAPPRDPGRDVKPRPLDGDHVAGREMTDGGTGGWTGDDPPLHISAKLVIQGGDRVVLVHAPPSFGIGDLPPDVQLSARVRPPRMPVEVVIAFFTTAAKVEAETPALSRAIVPGGGLWIAWPRRAGGGHSDITDNIVRGHGLSTGLVDVKIAALGEHWSTLRFTHRRTERAALQRSSRT